MSENWTDLVHSIVLTLSNKASKGQAGIVAIIGGSYKNTAPAFLAAEAALEVGADEVHIFCPRNEGPIMKAYSPEMSVHPLLDVPEAFKIIEEKLAPIHSVVLGPGMGRDKNIQTVAASIIRYCQCAKKPLVIDGDGLHLIAERPELVRDFHPPGVILTPNAKEYDHLCASLMTTTSAESPLMIFDKLGPNVVVLKKGATDEVLSIKLSARWSSDEGGCPRRAHGQGHTLAGKLGTFYHWTTNWYMYNVGTDPRRAAAAACYAAASLTRKCGEKAYAKHGRGMMCCNLRQNMHKAFYDVFAHK